MDKSLQCFWAIREVFLHYREVSGLEWMGFDVISYFLAGGHEGENQAARERK